MIDVRCAGIQRVLQQLLHDGGRALDHLARGDAVHKVRRKLLDRFSLHACIVRKLLRKSAGPRESEQLASATLTPGLLSCPVMKLTKLLELLEQIAPLKYAESWDNVGLLAGDPQQLITKAIVAIDYTPAVAEEAYAADCGLVIAYHPPIFDALKRLTAPSLVFDAIRRGLSIYSPHTALDVADGGTNDVLAEILQIRDPLPLRAISPSAWHYKLITFVPRQQADQVADALFDAGAGWIGNYSRCSFRSDGTGTFLGQEGTNPTVGRPGELERASETRIETIVPAKSPVGGRQRPPQEPPVRGARVRHRPAHHPTGEQGHGQDRRDRASPPSRDHRAHARWPGR